MVTTKTVSKKMETIQKIFRAAQSFSCEKNDWNELAGKLDALDVEFRSVAYEAASMNIALKDLSENKPLTYWLEFLQKHGKPHAIQIHVGLGWALAQQQFSPIHYLPLLEPMLRYRVFDGYGYYEGIFRKRKTIQQQQLPEYPDETDLKSYMQGLGRSLWYAHSGEIESAKNTLDTFPEKFRADLWRGLGIACAYVGGCDRETLEEIFVKTGVYKKQLATAAVMAAISRHVAGYMSDDTALACETWCKQNTKQLVSFHQPDATLKGNDAYAGWLTKIEASF